MLIDDIDFADLYLQQLRLAHRTEKTPDHWDQRAEKMAENCASPTDSYLQQLTSKIDLQGAQTLFDGLRTGYRIAGAGGQTHDDLWR